MNENQLPSDLSQYGEMEGQSVETRMIPAQKVSNEIARQSMCLSLIPIPFAQNTLFGVSIILNGKCIHSDLQMAKCMEWNVFVYLLIYCTVALILCLNCPLRNGHATVELGWGRSVISIEDEHSVPRRNHMPLPAIEAKKDRKMGLTEKRETTTDQK